MSPRILSQRYAVESVENLREHPRNARRGDEEFLAESLEANGFFGSVLADDRPGPTHGHVLVGNHRFRTLRRQGGVEVPVIWVTPDDDDHARRIMLADNASSDRASYERTLLAELLAEAKATPSGLAGTGHTEATLEGLLAEIRTSNGGGANDEENPKGGPTLAERFGVPPFSILDARQGYWQQRKREWLDLGLRSEIGRAEMLTYDKRQIAEIDFYKRKRARERAANPLERSKVKDGPLAGTSVFDPVLCEMVYRWFCPRGGLVLDPFAGGSVRGIVAAKLGRRYLGIDLRAEQVAANREQVSLLGEGDEPPVWIAGDSRTAVTAADLGDGADLVFSCPPYADLERYSDDPADLSTMDYADFRAAYAEIVAAAVARLRPNRFAVFVVGDVREPGGGAYRNFVGHTVEAFEKAGARLYNDAVMVLMIASVSTRAARLFNGSRKLGRVHQNVLIFCKGDPKKATEACGAVEGGLHLGDETLALGEEAPASDDEEEPEDEEPPSRRRVKVSAAMMRLRFAGCSVEYIRDVCGARCCESSSAPGGTMISIHRSEQAAIEARGGKVVAGLLQSVGKRCPFKTPAPANLCGLHATPDKPFGCIASPFTLNASGTLIVRNRYKLLKCYDDGPKLPAYEAFRASLDLIFGAEQAARLVAHFAGGGGDTHAEMTAETFDRLVENDETKRAAKAS